MRPHLSFTKVRGNVETRLEKLDRGEFDGLVMAVAGMARLGLSERLNVVFDPDQCVPAAGQGALAVQCRTDDRQTRQLVDQIDHREAHAEIAAERAFLRGMGGGCQVPIGALGRYLGGEIQLMTMVADTAGSALARWSERGPAVQAEALGERAANVLRESAARFLTPHSAS
jgi:hydroxymethylbilane synthase